MPHTKSDCCGCPDNIENCRGECMCHVEKEYKTAIGSFGTYSTKEKLVEKESWERKGEMMEFLKHILPYWQSEDLDDYAYVVKHYDLERVATKMQKYIDLKVKADREAVREEFENDFPCIGKFLGFPVHLDYRIPHIDSRFLELAKKQFEVLLSDDKEETK